MSLQPMKPLRYNGKDIGKGKKPKKKSIYKYGISESEVKKDKSLPYVMSFTDIKTPTTVEEFRENLLKYYVNYGTMVMVGRNDKNIGDFNVDDIERIDDLGICDGFEWNGSDFHSPTLMLTPTVVQIRDFDDYMDENFLFNCNGGVMGMEELCVSWWLNPQNNLIIDYQKMRDAIHNDIEYGKKDYVQLSMKYQKAVHWKNFYKEGNSLFRDYYMKTLGEFGIGLWNYDNEGNELETFESLTEEVN